MNPTGTMKKSTRGRPTKAKPLRVAQLNSTVDEPMADAPDSQPLPDDDPTADDDPLDLSQKETPQSRNKENTIKGLQGV